MKNGQSLQKRNNYIELERFVACGGVLLFHADIVPGSWIFVEFFFILTGFFTMQHMQNKTFQCKTEEQWYPLSYMWKRIRRVLPYTTIGILLIWLYDIFAWHLKGMAILKWILYLPTNLLLLNGFGVQAYGFELQEGVYAPDLINPHLWYIACMIPALIILVFLLQHTKKSRVLICALLPLLLLGILILLDGTIAGWHRETIYLFGHDMRALAEMLLGVDAWYAAQWLKEKKFSGLQKGFLTAAELILFFGIFVLTYFFEMNYEVLYVLCFAVSVALTGSGQTGTKHLNFRFFGFLGKISLPIYCFQMGISSIFAPMLPGLTGKLIMGVILLVFSILVYFIVESFRKKKKRIA